MTKYTDKKLLVKGLKYLAGSLPLLFLSPYFFTITFMNREHPWYYFGFSLALILGILAVFLIFKGLRTIMKALF